MSSKLDTSERLVFFPMTQGNSIDALLIFFINYLKIDERGAIIHITELDDMLSNNCGLVKANENIQKLIQATISSNKITSLMSGSFNRSGSPIAPCELMLALCQSLPYFDAARLNIKLIPVTVSYD